MMLKRIFKPLIQVPSPLTVAQDKPKSRNLIIIENQPKLDDAYEVITPQPVVKQKKQLKELVELEVVESQKHENQKVLYEVPPPVDILPPPDNMTMQKLKLVKPVKPVRTHSFDDILRNSEIEAYPRSRQRSQDDLDWYDNTGEDDRQYYNVPQQIDSLPPPDNRTMQTLRTVKPTKPVKTNQLSDFSRKNEANLYSRGHSNAVIGRRTGGLTQFNPARKSLWPWLITIPLGFLFLEGLSLILFQIRKKQFVFF